jgi:hypothetical protein
MIFITSRREMASCMTRLLGERVKGGRAAGYRRAVWVVKDPR